VARDVPDSELAKITYQNACRWYSFDPFAHRSADQCTVAALRGEAAGHDVSIHSFDKGRRSGKAQISLGELAEQATA
jgi:hypothetical protein